MAPDDDRYQGVLSALGELAQEIREHKAAVEQSWQTHRATVNAAIGLLSSELVRLQHIFDQFVGERKDERAQDDVARQAQRRRVDRFLWAIFAAIGVLIVINL